MPRTLPWLPAAAQPSASRIKSTTRKTPSVPQPPPSKRRKTTPPLNAISFSEDDDEDEHPLLPEPQSRKRSTISSNKPPSTPSREPSTSPPPPLSPPALPSPLRPEDALFIMVEDEFLSTAYLYTQHLHRAEYVRLKDLAKHKASHEIARPVDGRTEPSTELKMEREHDVRRQRREREVESLKGLNGLEGSEPDDEEVDELDIPDRNLAGLMAGDLDSRWARKVELQKLTRPRKRERAVGTREDDSMSEREEERQTFATRLDRAEGQKSRGVTTTKVSGGFHGKEPGHEYCVDGAEEANQSEDDLDAPVVQALPQAQPYKHLQREEPKKGPTRMSADKEKLAEAHKSKSAMDTSSPPGTPKPQKNTARDRMAEQGLPKQNQDRSLRTKTHEQEQKPLALSPTNLTKTDRGLKDVAKSSRTMVSPGRRALNGIDRSPDKTSNPSKSRYLTTSKLSPRRRLKGSSNGKQPEKRGSVHLDEIPLFLG